MAQRRGPKTKKAQKGPQRPSPRVREPMSQQSPKVWRRQARQQSLQERRSQLCSIKHQCGSCAYINTPYAPQLAAKFAAGIACLTKAAALNDCPKIGPKPAPKPLAYRTTVKLAIRPGPSGAQRFQIGLFAPGTHKVVPLLDCPLHAPAINPCLQTLTQLLNQSELTPWDESTGVGDLRYVLMRQAHKSREIAITFVGSRRELKAPLRALVLRLRAEHRIQGAFLNLSDPDQGNRIWGLETLPLVGGLRLREQLCDLTFELSPQSFFQANPWQAEMLYRRVEQLCGEPAANAVAWDLYAGVGPMSMLLARSGYRVFSIESNPVTVADGIRNARINGLDQIEAVAAAVGHAEIPSWAQHPELIVANPSRSGLTPESRQWLYQAASNQPSPRLIYVSCAVESLARDLAALKSNGWKLEQLEAFDMFPQTDKLEWLAVCKANA